MTNRRGFFASLLALPTVMWFAFLPKPGPPRRKPGLSLSDLDRVLDAVYEGEWAKIKEPGGIFVTNRYTKNEMEWFLRYSDGSIGKQITKEEAARICPWLAYSISL